MTNNHTRISFVFSALAFALINVNPVLALTHPLN